MSAGAVPRFLTNPFRYTRYAAHQYPARFWSVVIGGASLAFIALIPVRHALGYEDYPQVPRSYPLPNRRREPVPTEFDDPK